MAIRLNKDWDQDPEGLMKEFQKGMKEKAKREQNYHDNIEARDKIFGEVAGIKPEEFPAPYNEQRRDKLYDKGVYKKSQLPLYRAAYKRGDRRYQRQQRQQQVENPVETAQSVQRGPLGFAQMNGQSFADFIRQQDQHNSRWNATTENGEGYNPDINEWHYNDDGELVDKEGKPVAGFTDPADKLTAYEMIFDDDDSLNEAYNRANQSARKAFRDSNQEYYDTLESAFGVDPERIRLDEEQLKQIEKERRRSGLFHGLASVIDMVTAAGGGDVFKREADSRDYAKESQLIRAQQAADALAKDKAKNDYRLQLMKQEGLYADQAGKQAAADLKQRRDITQKRWQQFQTNNQKNIDNANRRWIAQKNAEAAANRLSMSQQNNTDKNTNTPDKTFVIGTGNGAKRVSQAMYESYVNTLMTIIRNNAANIPIGADPNADGNVTLGKAMKAYIYKNSNKQLMPVISSGGDQYDITHGIDGYPKAVLKKYLGEETLKALDKYWKDVLESGSAQ